MNRLRWLAMAAAGLVSLTLAVLNPLKAQSGLGEHQVRPGETLYCIGRGYGVSPAAIAQANGLGAGGLLSVGQVLTIPNAPWSHIPPGPVCAPQFTAGSTAVTAPSLTPSPGTSQVYIVQRGDSLWRIGRQFGVTVTALRAANNLQGSLIYVGQRLIIPGSTLSATVTPVQPTSGPAQTVPAPVNTPIPTLPPAEPTTSNPSATPGATEPPVEPTTSEPSPTPGATETASPLPTNVATAQPSATNGVPPPTETQPAPTATASPQPSATTAPATDPLTCAVPNIAWSQPGQLLRGGRPEAAAFGCLAAAGVDVIIDQRLPSEDSLNEPLLAGQAGLVYINLGVADDTAPSPSMLRAWIDTVAAHLAAGKLVLVHDAAGRGRMGFWDAVFFMRSGASAAAAVEDRYLAKALPFLGAKIGCNDGGNGQVQALAEIGAILTGSGYYPAVDEYGTAWADCPRPGYMDGWDYASVLP